MARLAHFRFLLLGIAITPCACARACAKPDMAAVTPSPGPSSVARAVASLGPDAAADGAGSVPSGAASSSAASSAFAAGGGACADVFETVSSCEALRALIAASDKRPELRACLHGHGRVAPPPGNAAMGCLWGELPNLGCLTGDHHGDAVSCHGDRNLPTTEHYDGFKRMATACLAGWKIDNLEKAAEGSVPGIEFSRTVRDGGAETVTHVQACKVGSNGEEVRRGEPQSYDLDINVYATTRQLEGGAR